MSIFKLIKYITNSRYRFSVNYNHGRFKNLSDEEFIKKRYKSCFGKELDLLNPLTFNEKLQWLKLYNRSDLYTTMVDKYLVKEYVGSLIGDEYIIPTLFVFEKFAELDIDMLPEQFVIKTTHDSGGVYICSSKKDYSEEEAKKIINASLNRDYYLFSREWPYKNVKRRIIIEKYMDGFADTGLVDYKMFCFHGKVYMTLVCSERFSKDGLKEDFYDRDWKKMNLKRPDHPNSNGDFQKPHNYELMLEIAEKLSNGIPFIRVDLYEIDGKVYFGELTFFPNSGLRGFVPSDWDRKLGELIDLKAIRGKN